MGRGIDRVRDTVSGEKEMKRDGQGETQVERDEMKVTAKETKSVKCGARRKRQIHTEGSLKNKNKIS